MRMQSVGRHGSAAVAERSPHGLAVTGNLFLLAIGGECEISAVVSTGAEGEVSARVLSRFLADASE